MINVEEYIASGILELYVMGSTNVEETAEVEQMAADHIAIRNEIDTISVALENYALANGLVPNPVIKPFVMAVIDYTDRLQKGEPVSVPPILNELSTIADFEPWLSRDDMVLPADFTDFHAKIIGYTPQVISAIVWIKDLAPGEVHDHEFEKFLIIEGSCNITIGAAVHQLVPGNVLSIPLHQEHFVKVTSAIPCKVILQRVAA